MPDFREKLNDLGACIEAIEWVGDQSGSEAWNACADPGWLLWVVRRSDNVNIDALKEIVKEFSAEAGARRHKIAEAAAVSASAEDRITVLTAVDVSMVRLLVINGYNFVRICEIIRKHIPNNPLGD